MSLIMGQIESEHPQLFALEFGKIAESNLVYTLATANVVPNSTTISTKHGLNVCDCKILKEFNY